MIRRQNTLPKESETPGAELKVEISIFKDYAKQKFKSIITAIDPENIDTKLLIMDRSFYDIFRLLFTKDEVGVGKITFFNEDLRTDCRHLIFLTPPSIQNMESLANIVKNNPNKNYYLINSPRRTFGCKEALQASGIYGSITAFNDFNFDLIPLDYDFLSLELPNACRQLYADLDTSVLVLIAESIHRLQLVFGRVNSIFSKGYSAKTINEIIKIMESESKLKIDDNPRGEIDCLVVLDRNLDFVTPMLTQFTYAGAMDEIWTIKQNNVIMLEKKFFPVNSVARPEGKEQDFITHKLQNDKVFKEIRDYHIQIVPAILDEKLAEIKSIHDEIAAIGSGKQENIRDMTKNVQKERKILEKDFDKIATHVEVRKHMDEMRTKPSYFKQVKTEQAIVDNDIKSQDVLEYIQTLIGRQAPLNQVLKLLCLQSQVEGGLKPGPLDTIKRDIILTYGFEHSLTLNNLERAGILKREGERKIWDTVSKQLKLVNPDFNDLKQPDDASFAYFGFCPILVRLVEQLFKRDGWNGIKSTIDQLPGPTNYDEKKGNLLSDLTVRNTVMVYVIGGLTNGEIAAFRYLSKKYNKEIILASTAIITGERVLSGFVDK